MGRNFEEWLHDKNIHGSAFEEEFYKCGSIEKGTIGWNAALDTVKENFNSLQQLKAEIAVLINEYGHIPDICEFYWQELLSKLRQLSAV